MLLIITLFLSDFFTQAHMALIFILILVSGIKFAPVREKYTQCRVGKGAQTTRSKPMLRIIGRTFSIAMVVLCLFSTLAMAAAMTCAKDNGAGNCIAAMGPDGKTVIVVGEGIKTGEEMDCQDRGNMINCEPIASYMTCIKDDGKGNCTEATNSSGKTIVVIKENFAKGDKMTCTEIPGGVHCVKLALK